MIVVSQFELVARQAREDAALDSAISTDRFATYMSAAAGDRELARALYVWDRDVSLTLLADIAILEIALRNCLSTALSETWGPRWFENRAFELDDRSLGQLSRAWRELPSGTTADREDPRLPGRLVARCMFGFWANLLDAGGHCGAEPRRVKIDYETMWRSTLAHAFRGGKAEARAEGAKYTRPWAHSAVSTVNALRNRIAHHEPLINGMPLPGQNGRRLSAAAGHQACRKLARLIDRDLAGWLDRESTAPIMLASRPAPKSRRLDQERAASEVQDDRPASSRPTDESEGANQLAALADSALQRAGASSVDDDGEFVREAERNILRSCEW